MLERKKLLIDLMAHETYKPMKIKELATILQLDKNEKKVLDELLQDLIREGKVIRTKRGKYKLNDQPNYLVGKFTAHPKGFGFVEIEGREEDIFIPGKYVGTAFHQDLVGLTLLKESRGERQEGQIIEILERGKETWVGLYEESQNFGFVVPDNKKIHKDIFISKGKSLNAMKGHKVVVRIIDWGDEDKKPEGEIIEIIGHVEDPETEILAIVKELEIPTLFSIEVKNQVKSIPQKVFIEEGENRLDIRHLPTVTIDGADAKDLDDAITLEKTEKGYVLGVHIADVTHYVEENSPLDESALERSTSVYLVDRVIPMLPRQLSNGICSLNAGEDRLALSCMMTLDLTGEVVDYKISETLIHVNERMTYKDVAILLEENEPVLEKKYSDYRQMFNHMATVAKLLSARRYKRGAIDFDFPEAKIELDEAGTPIDIHLYERNIATRIIESFMLLANEVVAEHFYWQEVPFVYRNHEKPDKDRINKLSKFVYNFGHHLKGKSEVHPREIQQLLEDIKGTNEEMLISRLTLRSMRQAKYEVDCEGHYGLAASYYTHFTSPIRRYPDLQIHRIIKESIHGSLDQQRQKHYKKILSQVTKETSEKERRAEQAERETVKLKKVEFMKQYLGDVFEGVISSVTSWGLYIELPNTIEGLIHVTDLEDDYYIYNEEHYLYKGERTGKVYALGDRIKVQVAACHLQERTIDFVLAKE